MVEKPGVGGRIEGEVVGGDVGYGYGNGIGIGNGGGDNAHAEVGGLVDAHAVDPEGGLGAGPGTPLVPPAAVRSRVSVIVRLVGRTCPRYFQVNGWPVPRGSKRGPAIPS